MQRKQCVATQSATGYSSIVHSDVSLTYYSELLEAKFRSEDDEPFPISDWDLEGASPKNLISRTSNCLVMPSSLFPEVPKAFWVALSLRIAEENLAPSKCRQPMTLWLAPRGKAKVWEP